VFWQPPLYPALLGVLYRIAGHTLWAPRLVQSLLGAATAAGVALLAHRVTNERRAAWIAGLAVAFHGVLVFYDGELLATSLALALSTWAVVLATRSPRTLRDAVGAGALTGLSALAVAPTVLVAPALAVVSWRRDRRFASWMLAGAIAIVATCSMVNRARGGEWVVVSANGGVNLWLGNNPEGESALAIRPGAAWEALMDEPAAAGAHTAAEQDRWFRDRALAFCASKPTSCVAGLMHKARLLVTSREMPRNEDLYLLRRQSPVLAALVWRVGWIGFPAVVLLPLAAAGAVLLARRREDAGSRAVLAALLALCAGPVVFFVTARHRAPVLPLACVAAAVACIEVAKIVQRRVGRDRVAMVAAVTGALVLVLALWPTRFATDGVNFGAEMYFEVAGRRARLGDHDGAIAALREALLRRPDYREAAVNLALQLAQTGRVDAAVAVLDDMLQYYPEDAAMRARRDAWRIEIGSTPP
jgi:4-amino-4-deoxy-L-arabinose transferase-like glycosyltransferase